MGVNGCPLAFFCTRGGPEDPESSQGLPNSNRCQFRQTPRLCGRHLDGYRGQLENNSEAVLALTGKEKAERQQQKTFSPDKLKCLTAAGPNTEVRNKINKGGSWHQWSPLARVCCFDDRQGELMRYDVARCTASPCCTVMMVTMRFLCSPGTTCVVSHQRCNRQHYARVFMRKLPTSVPMMFINPRIFFYHGQPFEAVTVHGSVCPGAGLMWCIIAFSCVTVAVISSKFLSLWFFFIW